MYVSNLENLCIEIRKPNSRPFLIATWYRPPCSSIDLFLCYELFLEKLDSLDLEYYLLGDFNCNLAFAQYDSNIRRLCEISDLFGLQQLIIEPTRITESSSTLIDLIYTNYIDRVACSGVCHISISDHSLIYVYRKLYLAAFSKEHTTISHKNFQNFNRESFRNDIAQQHCSCNGSEDPNILWTNWKTKFLDIANIHAPLRTRLARTNKPPWINSQLKKCMHDRDAAKRKAITSHAPHDWDKHKKLRNKVNSNIKTSKAS